LRAHNPAPHEALVPVGDVVVVSASPERFLRVDGRRVVTRPIKGTSSDADALRSSAKDRAENVMIVDLARNDLGRVCEYGSVDVPELCTLESHPGLFHLVSTVRGTLRSTVPTSELIRATFPPASVTGCPKPRVLQIIEELEPTRRGVYCGAVGFVDADRGVVDLNVAIRTFTVGADRTTLGVGAGIVADSDPAAEWEETELKARRLLRVASGAN
jgi:para-aminobenzoate synthetase component 1